MTDRTLRIERLRVRLHETPADAAARVGNALGDALATSLAPELARTPTGRVSIARLDVAIGPGQPGTAGGSAPETRVAAAVAGAIAQRLPARGGGS